MRLPRPYSVLEITDLIGGDIIGKESTVTEGINEIHVVEAGDIVFVDHHKYYDKTLSSPAAVVLIDQAYDTPEGKALIVVEDPFDAFKKLCTFFLEAQEKQVDEAATIDPSANVSPQASIGKYVSIGANTIIHPGVVLYDHTHVGSNVEIHANTVVGSDAFYFKRRSDRHDKMRSVGNVIIEDDVEIGSACTIDRGVTSSTVIGAGTKLDNQVHVGHDTKIGRRCLFAAQVGIAGCVTIEDEVVLWGQVGCAANITIGKGSVLMAQSGIAKDVPSGASYFGSPAGPSRMKMKELITLSMLSQGK